MRLIDADAIHFENAEFDTYSDYSRAFDAIDQAPTIKTFTLAEIEEQYKKGLEKGLEEAETKKCPIFSDDEVKQPCVKSPCGFERQHGEWITTSNIWEDNDLAGWGYWKECSCCHIQERRRTLFCPNCGAYMRMR